MENYANISETCSKKRDQNINKLNFPSAISTVETE